jgi:hypothetical protein
MSELSRVMDIGPILFGLDLAACSPYDRPRGSSLQPGQWTSSHGMPAMIAAQIVGDRHISRSWVNCSLQRSTTRISSTLRVTMSAIWSAGRSPESTVMRIRGRVTCGNNPTATSLAEPESASFGEPEN